MKNTYPVWMDVDTGTDDAVAILALHALEGPEIRGLSAVCGNCGLEDTFRNTRSLNTVMKTDYPVYAGADRPLKRERVHASGVHGSNGLGDVIVPLPENEVVKEEKAWDALYAEAKRQEGALSLIATGPLTNIATAILKYPDLPGLLARILIMGGGMKEGNVTPSAEFNFFADPDAAEIVLRCGASIVLCPLDVTEQAVLSAEDMEEIRTFGNEAGRFAHDILQHPWKNFHEKLGHPGVEMHDSCPVLYLEYPELFRGEEAGVYVETRGEKTLGRSVTDLYSDKQFPEKNALVLLTVDTKAFAKKLKELLRSI